MREPQHHLQFGGVLGLSMAGLVTMMTEILPAAVLRPMSLGLGTPEPLVGQMVSIYALSSAFGTIPLTAALRHWRRKDMLLLALSSFAAANMVTAISDSFVLTMVARLVAGLFGGLVWALLAGLASDLAPPTQRGRAISIAMVGVPVALACAIPAAAYLEALAGWRAAFGLLAATALLLAVWLGMALKRKESPAAHEHLSIGKTISDRQVHLVLLLTALLISPHTALHTFIVPVVARPNLPGLIPQALFLFGAATVIGTCAASIVIDRRIASLASAACWGFGLTAFILIAIPTGTAVGFATLAVWGLSFGTIVPVLQTACNRVCAAAPDVGQAILVTVWNVSITTGGLVGGVLLMGGAGFGIPWFVFVASLLALAVIRIAKPHGLARNPLQTT